MRLKQGLVSVGGLRCAALGIGESHEEVALRADMVAALEMKLGNCAAEIVNDLHVPVTGFFMHLAARGLLLGLARVNVPLGQAHFVDRRAVAHDIEGIETLLLRARGTGAREAYLLSTTAPSYFARWGFSLFPAEKVPAEVRASMVFRSAERTSALCMRCDLR